MSALNPLEIGSTVHYAGHDWTVTGARSGKDWPPELLDYVLLVRDQHIDSYSGQPAFTTMGVRLADLAHELYGPTSEHRSRSLPAMPYTAAKAECVMDLSPETTTALIMYLTRDWSLEQLEELIESTRWHDDRDHLAAELADEEW